jgi:hypothetical protein
MFRARVRLAPIVERLPEELQMSGLLSRRPSPALIVAVVALVCALTGTAWAALGKNSVGSKQLKKNAVTTAKIKKEAITANKVKKHSLTGQDIDLAKLGTVPSASTSATATNATNAVNATNAQNAVRAATAGTAGGLTPLEPVHFVGTPGEPPFLSGSSNVPPEGDIIIRRVGFYKDHEGIVHLEGAAVVPGGGSPEEYVAVFSLPPGFRPATKTALSFRTLEGDQNITVLGSNVVAGGTDYSGDVVLVGGGSDNAISLSGITFRAEG